MAGTDTGWITLEADDVIATVAPELGGRLASLRIRGRERLLGPPSPLDASIRWGCFLMAPWPGRLADAHLRWHGETLRVARTHGRHAIHGVGFYRAWTVMRRAAGEVDLELDLAAAGWPLGGTVRQRIRVAPGGIRFDASIVAERPTPAALGWHPWFSRGGTDPRITVAAERYLETRGMIPTGRVLPVENRLDLRSGPLLGSRRLDHAFVDVPSPARIAWPDLELELAFEPAPATWVVHTPVHAICIEPQTAWPNAFNIPGAGRARAGVRALEAGESMKATLELRWRP